MVLLQPRLNLKVSQKQILTPGLVQMVSVLALNKIELKEMINNELTENPVLEELETSIPLLDDVDREHPEKSEAAATETTGESKDPFDEIDFGSYFREYLEPGFRSPVEMEDSDKPSFEHFLSSPTTLTDHLMWQLGAMTMSAEVAALAELIIGNLNEDGYLTASDEELLAIASGEPASALLEDSTSFQQENPNPDISEVVQDNHGSRQKAFTEATLHEALEIVRQLDPIGVAARSLRECLLAQLHYLRHRKNGSATADEAQVIQDAIAITDAHLPAIQSKQFKEIAKSIGRPLDAVQTAIDLIRTLDPRPGSRYNNTSARLIEPDVAFVKHGDEFIVVMNDEDMPTLRLNGSYRKLLNPQSAEKDVRNYVKDRFKSALQLIRNIEQRKQTILKVCYSIIARQGEFLEKGLDYIAPMMIKDVAEEIGVHPSTVSRAVANKYVHTPQGVFELRYFFSESVQGPEGGSTSLMVLKRRVKQIIESEDASKPYTDEQITKMLQEQGIQVTRRTVAKYREDMNIPSTHQRRVRK
ncbi:MAG: RNA polymerase factor sigma-54 [Acidobacteriales bacterium]|nr:RNA polymerase factor sigma-54 [Terriglobales bacterium]